MGLMNEPMAEATSTNGSLPNPPYLTLIQLLIFYIKIKIRNNVTDTILVLEENIRCFLSKEDK